MDKKLILLNKLVEMNMSKLESTQAKLRLINMLILSHSQVMLVGDLIQPIIYNKDKESRQPVQ